MKAIICIQMDNAAFHADNDSDENLADGGELAAVLHRLAVGLKGTAVQGGDIFTARDTNGNTVAEMEITEDMLTV